MFFEDVEGFYRKYRKTALSHGATTITIHLSIHPLSSYLGLGCGSNKLSWALQTSFTLVPRPDEIYNPSSKFWVCPGVSSQLDVLGKPERCPGGVLSKYQKYFNYNNTQHTRSSNSAKPISLRWTTTLEKRMLPKSSYKF